jgi:hypothetical protein
VKGLTVQGSTVSKVAVVVLVCIYIAEMVVDFKRNLGSVLKGEAVPDGPVNGA